MKDFIGKNIRRALDTPVLWLALIPVALVMIGALGFGEPFQAITDQMRNFLGTHFGWFYLTLVLMCVAVSVYVIFRPIGRIRLGDRGSKPEYSTFSWIAMLFSAGMGIGLVFYGAAEPLSHYAVMTPGAQTFSQEAMRDALVYSFFHYGVSAWAVYGMVALSIAYFQFRKKESTQISATLKPLLGDKTDGIIGYVIDALAVFATVIGVATSLGLGAAQINSGLSYLFGIEQSVRVQLLIIVVATVLYLMSALSGIGKGVKILSDLNIILAVVLLIMGIIVGPRLQMVNALTEGIGIYLKNFVDMSFQIGAFSGATETAWIQKWTIFYWSWWISWSPFVGLFIARISKGRTIREFLSYVLLVPSLFSFVWFSVFGTMGMNVATKGSELTQLPIEQMLFGVFEAYPMGMVLSIIAIFLLFSFFITSADSATFVLAAQSENGTLNPHNKVKLMWGLVLSGIAAALLANGGLQGLQNVLIIIAFPFSIILFFMVVSVIKELRYERYEMGLYLKVKRHPKPDAPFRSYETDEEE